MDEKELIRQLQTRSLRESAFTYLVQKYQKPLYWQIRNMVLDHDDADDILQNTFMKAWDALDNFRGEARLSTWLYRIAINESISHLDREKKKHHCDISNEVLSGLAGDPYFDGDETQQMLQEAINRLPRKQRIVFQMKYLQEMKYEEMSHILQTSIGALKASYHLAVNKVTEFFETKE